MGRKFYIKTFGCQMNIADTERISGLLEQSGFERTYEEKNADILLLNTCAVREKSENKVYSTLGRWKKTFSGKIIGVVGCVAQAYGEHILKRFENVSFVLGTVGEWNILDAIKDAENGEKTIDTSLEREIPECLPAARESRFKAWVNIIYGCDKFCTYCIVPYTRGRERSRNPERIIQEVRSLIESGYKEITLLGQNVNSYGKDFPHRYRFPDLLREVDSIAEGVWIRYTTSYPSDFNDELIDVVAGSKNICRNFHLPLQSGSDRILKKMNRRYTLKDYRRLITRLRETFPVMGLTTDLIVGFPSETEEDFSATLDAVKEFQFDMGFTAIYSPRPFTLASLMPDDVPMRVKRKRINLLNELLSELSLKNNLKRVGKVYKVLVDGPAQKGSSLFQGRNEENIVVVFPGDKNLTGSFVKVRILQAKKFYLIGEQEE